MEKEERLGGQVVWAVRVTNRAEFGDIVRNLLHEIEQLDVDVRTGVAATRRDRAGREARRGDRRHRLDARPRPPFPAPTGPSVADVTDILSGAVTPGKRVLVIDRLGFHEATSTAEFMAEQGCEVEVVTQTLYVGQDLGVTLDLENWYRQARRLGITCTPNHSVLSIENGVVTALHNYSGQIVTFPKVDTIVLAIHRHADCSLYDALKGRVPELHRIGDCVAPRRAHAAIIEGEQAGRAV